MSRIKVPKLFFTYVNAPDSKERLQRAYNRIFAIARRNIHEKERSGKLHSRMPKNNV